MLHLESKLAEFVFEELPELEMESAREHVSGCKNCQDQVADFRAVQHALKTVRDLDVPRRTVLVESRQSKIKKGWSPLGWLVPSATVAAILIALVIGGPIDLAWYESGMTIAFNANDEAKNSQRIPMQVVDLESEPLDYERIVAEVVAEQRSWLQGELFEKVRLLSVANKTEVQRLQAELSYLFDLQRAAQRDTFENSSSIQILAARTEVQK